MGHFQSARRQRVRRLATRKRLQAGPALPVGQSRGQGEITSRMCREQFQTSPGSGAQGLSSLVKWSDLTWQVRETPLRLAWKEEAAGSLTQEGCARGGCTKGSFCWERLPPPTPTPPKGFPVQTFNSGHDQRKRGQKEHTKEGRQDLICECSSKKEILDKA